MVDVARIVHCEVVRRRWRRVIDVAVVALILGVIVLGIRVQLGAPAEAAQAAPAAATSAQVSPSGTPSGTPGTPGTPGVPAAVAPATTGDRADQVAAHWAHVPILGPIVAAGARAVDPGRMPGADQAGGICAVAQSNGFSADECPGN